MIVLFSAVLTKIRALLSRFLCGLQSVVSLQVEESLYKMLTGTVVIIWLWLMITSESNYAHDLNED